MSLLLALKPGNAGGGKGPQFKTNALRGEGPGDWATYQLRRVFRNCRRHYTRKRRQKPAIASTPCTTRSAARTSWRMPMPSAAPTRARRGWMAYFSAIVPATRLSSASQHLSLVVASAVVASSMRRQASSNRASSAFALAKCNRNNGINAVEPLDRHAENPRADHVDGFGSFAGQG